MHTYCKAITLQLKINKLKKRKDKKNASLKVDINYISLTKTHWITKREDRVFELPVCSRRNKNRFGEHLVNP